MKSCLIKLFDRVSFLFPGNHHYEKMVGMLFRALLKREPDDEARFHWVRALRRTKGDVGSMVESILETKEFALIPKPHPSLQLKTAYRTLLPKIRAQEVGNPLTIWDKPALVFLHMNKTGGSTLFHWLAQYFHPLQICPTPGGYLSVPESAEEFLRYKFISGHTGFPQCQGFPHPNRTIITMLRDPKKRLYSFYHYSRSLIPSEHNEVIKIAHSCDFKSFLKLKGKVDNLSNHCDNPYLRFLTGSFIGPSGNDPLDGNIESLMSLAKKNLDQMDGVGILEEFEVSIGLFSKILQLGDVDPQKVKPMNVLAAKKQKFEYAVIDEETDDLMEQFTNHDQVLYDYAKQVLAKQCIEHGIEKKQRLMSEMA